MGMKAVPEIIPLGDGARCWAHAFESFRVKVYVPREDPLADTVNFGFKAPYLLVFEETERSMEDAVRFAEESGLAEIARQYSTSVVSVFPASGSWETASPSLFADLIAESRIHEYFRDGVVTAKNRFTGLWEDCFIRGAIYRTCVYGFGASADWLARNCMKTLQGQYLWGPGEITPAVLSLERLSVMPAPEREDIPVISVGNPEEIDRALGHSCRHLLIKREAEYAKDFRCFAGRWRRWCGVLQEEEDMDALGMTEEPAYETVRTSPDNRGDDQGTEEHRIGYVAYYNKDLFSRGPVPLLLAFHGGGDSAFYIADISGWYRIAHKYGFLLVSVENHLNSTAAETVELIEKLKKKYPVDEHRIYASGFSMGGCKSWDLMQEYPQVFAALAPMDATFEVGLNLYGQKAPKEINSSVPVPVFYAGGEITPLPELPFQAGKCLERIRWLFGVNRVKTPYSVRFEDRENWPEKIWGIRGDRVEKTDDPSRGSVLTVNLFESEDGVFRTALASISGQGHECREHTCDRAWRFMAQFTRR